MLAPDGQQRLGNGDSVKESQYLAKEFLGTRIFGVGKKCFGWAVFNNHAVIGEVNVIGNFPRKSHLMRHKYACHAVLC